MMDFRNAGNAVILTGSAARTLCGNSARATCSLSIGTIVVVGNIERSILQA